MRKEVKIIGLSIKEKFGTIQATDLKFDANMKLTMIKGEVGAGKTTLLKAIMDRIPSQSLQSCAAVDIIMLLDTFDNVANISHMLA